MMIAFLCSSMESCGCVGVVDSVAILKYIDLMRFFDFN